MSIILKKSSLNFSVNNIHNFIIIPVLNRRNRPTFGVSKINMKRFRVNIYHMDGVVINRLNMYGYIYIYIYI